jgi:hypothetical protein
MSRFVLTSSKRMITAFCLKASPLYGKSGYTSLKKDDDEYYKLFKPSALR